MFQWVVLTAVNCQSWWACTYLLNGLKEIIGRNQDGLYRDDMLAYLRNLSGPQTTSIEKKLFTFFKSHKLQITIETNIKQTDSLNIHFDLESEIYKPYRIFPL